MFEFSTWVEVIKYISI